jgi:hypothetical protein
MKQNSFADFVDFMSDGDSSWGVIILIGLCYFIAAWIYFGTFVGALLIVLVGTPVIALTAVIFFSIAAIFSHHEGDGWGDHLFKLILAFPLLGFSTFSLYFLYFFVKPR